MKSLAIAVAFLGTLLGGREAESQYLTGNDRASFVSDSFNACLKGYGKDELTSLVPKPLFEEYCRCYSNGVADRISIRDMQLDNRVVTDPIVKQVARVCYDGIKAEALRHYQQKY